MDAIITGSLITAGSAVLIALVPVFTIFTKNEIRYKIKKANRSVTGCWEGKGTDQTTEGMPEYKRPESYTIKCDLHQIGSYIKGVLKATSTLNNVYITNIKGHIANSYLYLHHSYHDRNTTGSGVMLMELSPTGKELNGYVLGRRMVEHGISLTSTLLIKKNKIVS